MIHCVDDSSGSCICCDMMLVPECFSDWNLTDRARDKKEKKVLFSSSGFNTTSPLV